MLFAATATTIAALAAALAGPADAARPGGAEPTGIEQHRAASTWAAPRLATTIIIRTPAALPDDAACRRIVKAAAKAQVTTIAMSVKQDEDEPGQPSGRVFYPSRIAPVAAGYERFDALGAMVKRAHAEGIRVVAWVPQFHDAAAIDKFPDAAMATLGSGAQSGRVVPYVGEGGERFASPGSASVRDYERSIVMEVASTYAVDGVALDWVRFDGWETGMEDSVRLPFLAESGLDPTTLDLSRDDAARAAWGDYRARLIAQHVGSVRTALDTLPRRVELGAYVLTPEWTELSQDPALLAPSLDWIAPMAYFDDWQKPPSWVWRGIVPAVHDRAPTTRIAPVLDTDWTRAQNRAVLAGLSRTGYVRGVSWFAYGAWPDRLIKRVSSQPSSM